MNHEFAFYFDIDELPEVEILSDFIALNYKGEIFDSMVSIAYALKNRQKSAIKFYSLHKKSHHLFGDGTLKSAFDASLSLQNTYLKLDILSHPHIIKIHTAALWVYEYPNYDSIFGATHFHHHRNIPAWAKNLKPTALIHEHLFYVLEGDM